MVSCSAAAGGLPGVCTLDVHGWTRYVHSVIQEFKDSVTAALFAGLTPRGIGPDIVKRAHLKLHLLDAAATLSFLRSPPGNRLQKLSGDREGQHSIRINDQYRICFEFRDGHAYQVEVCDYH